MSETTFDTLRYSKKLKEVGFTEQQAEVQAEAIKELIDDKLSTKTDLKQTEERLNHKLRELEERLSYKLTIRFGGMLVAAVLVLAAIIKL